MPPKSTVSEKDFIRLFEELGPRPMARKLGIHKQSVIERRRRIEAKYNINITSPTPQVSSGSPHPKQLEHPARQHLQVENGVVLVGSDAHYWPGDPSTAHRAFVKFCRDLKPDAVVMNGDVFDGASASRHPPIGWERRPTLEEEIKACQTRLGEIVRAVPKAKTYWCGGNHDFRFETRIATVAPEYAKIHGVHLKDHFGANWITAWALWVNNSVVIKHRFKGGVHATHNNALWSGKSIVTGHLHSLKVTPLTDYNGTRYGVDTGTLAIPYGPQFDDYCENNPVNWRSGFAVLTFHKGRLLWPEVVHVSDEKAGLVEFRGKVQAV